MFRLLWVGVGDGCCVSVVGVVVVGRVSHFIGMNSPYVF